jgi:hypothetical protein
LGGFAGSAGCARRSACDSVGRTLTKPGSPNGLGTSRARKIGARGGRFGAPDALSCTLSSAEQLAYFDGEAGE